MITKITVNFPHTISYTAKKNPGEYGQIDFFQGHEQLKNLADAYQSAATLILYMAQHPEMKAERAIHIQFPDSSISVSDKTKKKRVYRTQFLVIHEED